MSCAEIEYLEERFGAWPRWLRVKVRPFLNAHRTVAALWGNWLGRNGGINNFVEGVWAARFVGADNLNKLRYERWRAIKP